MVARTCEQVSLLRTAGWHGRAEHKEAAAVEVVVVVAVDEMNECAGQSDASGKASRLDAGRLALMALLPRRRWA